MPSTSPTDLRFFSTRLTGVLPALQLFGNKAVKYTVEELDGGTVIVGCLRADQVPVEPFSEGYFLRVDVGFDVRWNAEDNRAQLRLLDMILGSMRTLR